MTHTFQFLNTKKDIQVWLTQMNIKNYTINPDLTVDVKGQVDLENKKLDYLPIQFNQVEGDFCISSNKLTSLLGTPLEVLGHFDVRHNQLVTLDYLPMCHGSYYLSHNKIKSLKGLPLKVNGDLACSSNELTTLEFGPEIVLGKCDYSRNKITTLKFCPKIAQEHLRILNNKITHFDMPSLKTKKLYINGNCIKKLDYEDIINVEISETLFLDEKFINKKATLPLKKAVIKAIAQNDHENVVFINFNQYKEESRLIYEKNLLENLIYSDKSSLKVKI